MPPSMFLFVFCLFVFLSLLRPILLSFPPPPLAVPSRPVPSRAGRMHAPSRGTQALLPTPKPAPTEVTNHTSPPGSIYHCRSTNKHKCVNIYFFSTLPPFAAAPFLAAAAAPPSSTHASPRAFSRRLT